MSEWLLFLFYLSSKRPHYNRLRRHQFEVGIKTLPLTLFGLIYKSAHLMSNVYSGECQEVIVSDVDYCQWWMMTTEHVHSPFIVHATQCQTQQKIFLPT